MQLEMQLGFASHQRLARRRDPETSKAAAEKTASFSRAHCGLIHVALVGHGPMTAKQLEVHTGLTNVQICRRLPELKKGRMATPLAEDGTPWVHGKKPKVIDGSRVWGAMQ